MSDYIDREAAKQMILEEIHTGMEDGYLRNRRMKSFVEGLEYAIDLLDHVPSVEVNEV